MSRLRFCLFAAVLCSITVLGQGDVTTEKPVTIPVPTSAASVPESSKTTTTEPITTSTEPTTSPEPTTTPKPTPPTTTTPKPTPPTTTTPKPTPPTTTPKPTPPTTPEPTPPTTPKPTPAPPAPTPVPPPKMGSWAYTNETNVTCILVQFAAQLNVTYTKMVNSSTSPADVLLNISPNATVSDGFCGETEQWLTLTWPVSNATNASLNQLYMVFEANATTKTYALTNLTVTLMPEAFPNTTSKVPFKLTHGEEWRSPLSTSYRCGTPTKLRLTSDATSLAGTITLSQMQEEAFKTGNNKKFSAARDCSGDDVPDAVPIAVGCALGGLVIVVLVAYLIGRRRSAARGYLSM